MSPPDFQYIFQAMSPRNAKKEALKSRIYLSCMMTTGISYMTAQIVNIVTKNEKKPSKEKKK